MNMIIKTTAFFTVCLSFAAYAGESFTGKVVGITDGDTIKVMRDEKAVKVRLHGVDCPERRQAFGTVAKKYTSDLVFGKQVTVELRGKSYYRLVGRVVLLDGRCLNEELVKAGLGCSNAVRNRQLLQSKKTAAVPSLRCHLCCRLLRSLTTHSVTMLVHSLIDFPLLQYKNTATVPQGARICPISECVALRWLEKLISVGIMRAIEERA